MVTEDYSTATSSVSVYSLITDTLQKEIIEFLNRTPAATVYHHPLWLKILSEESSQKYIIIIYRKNNTIEGLLPLLFTRGVPFVNSLLSSRRISSLPRTPYAGILAVNRVAEFNILEELKKISSEHPGYLIQLKSSAEYDKIDNTYSSAEWRSSYIKMIPESETLSFNSKKDEKDIFRAIKRAKERDVFIKKGETLEELYYWYNLYLYVMRQNRIPARKFSFFKNLWDTLKPANMLDVNFACIKASGKTLIINGTINYKFNDKYFGGFKAGDYRYSTYMGGDYLLYNEMLELQQQGIRSYDLGEVSGGNKTLDKYKTKWGVETFRIFHNYFGELEKNHLLQLDSEPGSSLISRLWKKVPLNVTAQIGGAVNYFL